MRQTNVRGTLSLRGFRKLRTGAIVATGVILLGLGFLAPTVSANEQDGVWVARTVAEVKADIQNIDNLSHYTIKWGDTLSAISGATGLSVDSLVEINRIANRDLIFANNKLYFSEEAFLKDGNTEVKRQRVSIDNSGSCQSYEVETKTDTVTGEQRTTVKQTTPVVVETPAVAAPKSETSVSVAPKAETKAETSNSSTGVTNEGHSGASTPVTDNSPSDTGTTNQPVVSNPSSEAPASLVPELKAETPAAPELKAEAPSTQPSDPTPTPVTPSETSTPAQPAGEVDTAETSNPSTGVTNEGDSGASTPVTDDSPSDTGTTDQPVAPVPSSEAATPKLENPSESAPKSEELDTSAPKSEETTTSAPKNAESGSSVESPSTGNHSEESETPSTIPASGSTATQPSDPTSVPVTPSETSTPAQPAGEVDKSETKAETSNSSTGVTNEGHSGVSTPVTETTPSNAETTNQPVSSSPDSEALAPKSEEPAPSTPKNDESSSSVESPSTDNHSEESETPSTTPAGGSTVIQPSDSTPTPVTPSETSTPAQPAGEVDKSETKAETSNSSTGVTSDGHSGASTPVTETTPSNAETTNQPVVSNPSSETPAPSVPELKAETPAAPESKAEAPSTQPSDPTPAPVTPSETSTSAQPVGEVDKSETKAETSNPSSGVTSDGHSGASTPVTETTNQPVVSNPSSEAPAPKADTPSKEIAPKDEKLEEAKKDGKDIIEKIAASKLSEIEKVKDEAEKAKLEAKLKELKEAGLEAINNAENHDVAVDATAEYQSKIDEIDVPGEELPAPNYNKDNLTNGRNEGTTIDNGSTAIGHGSGEAPTQPATEERSTSIASPTQPASTETTAGTSSFRNAPSVQARARRVARSTSEPDGTVNISYNFAGMPDIHGFLSDPGENNTVMIPAGTNEEQAKELVKEKIQAKIKDLATRGYHVKNDIIFEQDTTVKNYNYVVTFTKEATGTSGFRMAPAVQPRASRNRRSLEQPAPQKVKVNVFYNFDKMKDIAGFLGDINGTSLEIAEGLSNEEVKVAVKNQVEAKKEELSKRGYTFKEDYVYQANGKDYNYVVTFSKATK